MIPPRIISLRQAIERMDGPTYGIAMQLTEELMVDMAHLTAENKRLESKLNLQETATFDAGAYADGVEQENAALRERIAELEKGKR